MKPPEPDDRKPPARRRWIDRLRFCLLLGLLCGGKPSTWAQTPELIRQQEEEEARRKVLRASDILDQMEGTVEGHTRELQQLQQELSRIKEELRGLRERLAQASAASSESEKAKPKGEAPAPGPSPSRPTSRMDGGPQPRVVTGYYYQVQPGDTISAIAEAYRQSGVPVTAAQIRAANGLSKKEKLRPGQKLFIPKTGIKKGATPDTGTAPSS
ncbi:protein of unknown function [Methylacidimicrobium sp. AP8]|nr:protein of unknown function [Methylacidimicrobium sp. AP8]